MFRNNRELHENNNIANEDFDFMTIAHERSIRRPYETRSLVFRSIEDKRQKHTSISTENQTYMNDMTLFEYCRTRNWNDARKRALSHPREASKYMNGSSNRPTPLLMACAKASKFERLNNLSFQKVAPLETIQAIAKACPIQLRYPTSLEMFFGGTPLHEAIMNPSMPLDVIKFLILADDFWNNPYDQKNHNIYPSVSKGGTKISECNKYSENTVQPFFFQKSSCRVDSMGCTPLHVWVNRVFGSESNRFLFEQDENIIENERNPPTNLKIGTSTNACHTQMEVLEKGIMKNAIFNHYEDIIFNNSEYKLFNNEEDIFTITKLLIQSNPEAIALKDKRGRNPLVIVLQWMCSLQDPASRNEIIKKIGIRMARIVQIMVKACPSAVNVQCSTFGCSALHYAIMFRRSFKIIEYLIEASPRAAMIRNITGELPLHIACSMAAPFNILELILNAGLEALAIEDRGGRTALHWIWIRYIESTASSYIDNTINPFPKIMNPLKRHQRRHVPYNWNALQSSWFTKLYANIGHEGFRESFMTSQFWKTTELFLKAAHFHSGNNQNFHLLHVAATTSCPRAIIFVALALYPNEVKVKDDQNRLLIHIAASRPFNKRWNLDKFDNYFMTEIQNVYPHATIPKNDSATIHGIKKTENAHCSLIDTLLRMYPMSAKIADGNNRLPIHIAIDFEKEERQYAKKMIGRVQSLMRFSPYLLSTRDGEVNGMLSPFMLAGSGDNGDFNMSYELLRAGPEAVNNAISI